MNESLLKQCGQNLADSRLLNRSAEKRLLNRLERKRARLIAEFEKCQHFADPRVLDMSRQVDEIVMQILKIREKLK